ncbi:MAG: hypothetical protein AAFX00_13355 [Pseudomonadota bacterium]
MTNLRADPSGRPPSVWDLFQRRVGMKTLGSLLILCVFTVALGMHWQNARLLARDGIDAVGTVSERYEVQTEDEDGRISSSYYLILDVPGGAPGLQIDVEVGRNTYLEAVEGQMHDIRYLPSKPGVHELSPGAYGERIEFFGKILLLFWMVPLWTCFMSYRWAKGGVRAREEGAVETAEVVTTQGAWSEVSIGVGDESSGSTRKGVLVWRMSDRRRGRSLPHGPERFQVLGPGSRVTVYRLGRRSWWDGDVGRRAGPGPDEA